MKPSRVKAAIKTVAKHHSMPRKNGSCGWILYMPYTVHNLAGVTCSSTVSGSYQKALQQRRCNIAYDAVMLLTDNPDKAANASYDVYYNKIAILDAVMAAINRLD